MMQQCKQSGENIRAFDPISETNKDLPLIVRGLMKDGAIFQITSRERK